MSKKINPDGSIEGGTFSGPDYEGGYPPKKRSDRYCDYHDRVNEYVKKGFHLGDLSWSDWRTYCMGSGTYEGVDSSDYIFND